MLRASLISLALLVGGGSVAFAEDPMPAEGGTAQAAPKTPEVAKSPKAAKHHHKNKARNKKPAAPKKHKHHAKKTK